MTVNLVLKSLSAEMPLKDEENLLSFGQAGLREGGGTGDIRSRERCLEMWKAGGGFAAIQYEKDSEYHEEDLRQLS